jgi:mono/diheme cytochrome c family protein
MSVGDDPVGETYWKIKNGIRLTGMPAYGKVLSETQLWQVSLLLSMADKPLPAEASKTVGR